MTETSSALRLGPGARRRTRCKRVRIHHLRAMKERGERFAMLTAYDQLAAEIFDEAGIPVLLVGDSAANNVLGYETTLPVTVDELLPLVRAVSRSAQHALVVADLPFGSYQSSPEQALETSVRFMKEGGAHAVKLEGGARRRPAGRGAGHGRDPGDGPHRVHAAERARPRRLPRAGPRRRRRPAGARRAGAGGGRRLRRRPGDGARRRRQAGHRRAGDPDHRHRRRGRLRRPGARLAGHGRAARPARCPRFVKQYADLRTTLDGAARAFADDVAARRYPGEEHTYH